MRGERVSREFPRASRRTCRPARPTSTAHSPPVHHISSLRLPHGITAEQSGSRAKIAQHVQVTLPEDALPDMLTDSGNALVPHYRRTTRRTARRRSQRAFTVAHHRASNASSNLLDAQVLQYPQGERSSRLESAARSTTQGQTARPRMAISRTQTMTDSPWQPERSTNSLCTR